MANPLLQRKVEKLPDRVRLEGRILFLTEDPKLIRRQLAGEDLAWMYLASPLTVAASAVAGYMGEYEPAKVHV